MTCKKFEYILTTNVECDRKGTLEFHNMGNLASPIVMHSNRTAILAHCLTKTCLKFLRKKLIRNLFLVFPIYSTKTWTISNLYYYEHAILHESKLSYLRYSVSS